MPRVVPTEVVAAINRMFPSTGPHTAFSVNDLPSLAALVQLVEAVPSEFIRLEPQEFADFTAGAAAVKGFVEMLQATRSSHGASMALRNYAAHPIEMLRSALIKCKDEAPSPDSTELTFIADAALRDSIRLDISEANRALAEGQWKGATVLAGSALEALLLRALQEHEAAHAGARAGAVSALLGNATLKQQPHGNPERWDLHEYIAVARHLGLINTGTAIQASQAREFRNLIHPGRAQRLGQTCDRATALAALAAVEFVARDLTP